MCFAKLLSVQIFVFNLLGTSVLNSVNGEKWSYYYTGISAYIHVKAHL